MKRVVKLNRHYDIARLNADLDIARRISRRLGGEHENRGDYHDGGWSAIPLIAPGGRIDAGALRWAGRHADYRATPILDACSYFAELIRGFRCPTERVRLLRLAAGAVIHEHRDDGDGWAVGKVRLHVPITTHSEVYFFVAGHRVIMHPGQLWYCDFTTPHSVANRGDADRVHLVLDLFVNDWLRALFPPESPAEQLHTALLRTRYETRAGAYRLARKLQLGQLRRTVLALARPAPAAPAIQAPQIAPEAPRTATPSAP